MKATDLKEEGFYWMRERFGDGSTDIKIVEYKYAMIAKCGDDRLIFDTEFALLGNCEFFGPISMPDELLQSA